ncbi:hypothetical protein Kisp01_71080 [Kineosporia sp. NBRC 101677]|nr:hypothetical protein Kisp01_71080 [Kineosporia sp. NBRC 101677]
MFSVVPPVTSISRRRFGTSTVAWDAFVTAHPTAQTLVLYTAEPASDAETVREQVRCSLEVTVG